MYFSLKQVQEQADTFQDHLHEMSKPLARYQDDEDLDQMLREEERIEDPMLAFIKKKKKKSTAAVTGGFIRNITEHLMQKIF